MATIGFEMLRPLHAIGNNRRPTILKVNPNFMLLRSIPGLIVDTYTALVILVSEK